MVVQRVDNALGVGIPGIDDVASLLLRLVADLREASFQSRVGAVETGLHTKPKVTESLLHGGDVVLLRQLVLVTHSLNQLLGLAAAVLQRLDDVQVTHLGGIDNPFCREADLSGHLLDSSLYIAATLLQGVEVDVERLRELAQCEAVTLYRLLDAVGIRSVLQLGADGVQLGLCFDTLRGSRSRTVSVSTETESTVTE